MTNGAVPIIAQLLQLVLYTAVTVLLSFKLFHFADFGPVLPTQNSCVDTLKDTTDVELIWGSNELLQCQVLVQLPV